MQKLFKQLIWVSWIFAGYSALAADPLPYSRRTHPYNGWNSSVHGDNRTIGMGGATVALGDTFLASTENPAGLAMTLEGIDLNISNNRIRDVNIQNYLQPINLGSAGIAVNHHPWGFSIGFFNNSREGQEYFLPSNGGNPAYLETSVSEIRLGMARLFNIDNKALALGIALNFGTAEESIDGRPQQSSALGLIGAAMYQLPNRLLLGVSYQLPVTYPVPSTLDSPILPGFYQVMKVPSRLLMGLGWIPNRIFRAGVSFSVIGESTGTALLRDDNIMVGNYSTFQPRLGFAYTFADFSVVHSRVYVGSYLENTRITDSGRLHATIGLQSRFWFLTLGYSADLSVNYVNNSFSLGIDVIRMISMLELIPKVWHPPYAGFLPPPFEPSDVGLPRPLVENWVPHDKPLDPIKVGMAIPGLVEKKFEEIKNEITSLNLRSEKKEDNAEKKGKKKSKKKSKSKKSLKRTTDMHSKNVTGTGTTTESVKTTDSHSESVTPSGSTIENVKITDLRSESATASGVTTETIKATDLNSESVTATGAQ